MLRSKPPAFCSQDYLQHQKQLTSLPCLIHPSAFALFCCSTIVKVLSLHYAPNNGIGHLTDKQPTLTKRAAGNCVLPPSQASTAVVCNSVGAGCQRLKPSTQRLPLSPLQIFESRRKSCALVWQQYRGQYAVCTFMKC